MTIQYRVLGPLTVSDGERDVALPAGHQRTLLAALLLRGNVVVTQGEGKVR